nr:hypothetical protein [Tanacetum cinerariifolium]
MKGTPNLGLWGCQILGGKLVCWSAKKQSSVAMSSAKAEYVVAVRCCAQVLWIKSQMDDYDVLYDKETVRDSLATLRLIDENDTFISSFDLANSSPLKMRYFSPTWRVLMQYIGDNYNNNILKTLKPHHITSISFKAPSASEFPLTSHMIKVAKFFEEQYKSLILSSREVNTVDSVDKSLSGTNIQPITQSKAKTNKKSKKKRIVPSSKPKTLNMSGKHLQLHKSLILSPLSKQWPPLMPPQSINASESVGEFRILPQTVDSEMVTTF